jgi:hypothetical protein
MLYNFCEIIKPIRIVINLIFDNKNNLNRTEPTFKLKGCSTCVVAPVLKCLVSAILDSFRICLACGF